MQLFSSPKSQFHLFPPANPNPSAPKSLSKIPLKPFSSSSFIFPAKNPLYSSIGPSPPPSQERLLLSDSDDEEDELDDKKLSDGGIGEKGNESDGIIAIRRPVKEITEEVSSDFLDDGSMSSSRMERGLSDLARKMPIFEPERVQVAPGEKPLGINLELGLYRAKVLTRKFKVKEAEKLLRKCLLFWPEDGRAYVALGKLLSKQLKFEEARSVYERGCQATQGENSYIWQCWAVLENKVGNIRRARELFDAATVADKRHIAAWHGWAVLEIKHGNVKKARGLLAKGLKYCGGNEYIYQTLALLEAKGDRFDQARYLFQQAILCNPKSCASWLAWAQVEMQQGNNDIARQLFEKTVQASPKNRFAWHVWALFETNQGDTDKGRKLLKIGHALNPRDPVLLQSLALLEYKHSSANLARVLFRKASELDPRHQPVWMAWGWMEWKEGNINTARELYQRVLSIDSTTDTAARCLQAWGVLEQKIGNLSAARRLFRSSLTINSQSYITWMTWASLEEEQGNPIRAEEIRDLYFQQRTEVVDDASWVMGVLDIIDPAIDSIKRLLSVNKTSDFKGKDVLKNINRLNTNVNEALRSLSPMLFNTERSEDNASLNKSEFDLDTFIRKRFSLDASKLDHYMESFEAKKIKSYRRTWRPDQQIAVVHS